MIPKNPHDFYINNRIVYKYVVVGNPTGLAPTINFPRVTVHESQEDNYRASILKT